LYDKRVNQILGYTQKAIDKKISWSI